MSRRSKPRSGTRPATCTGRPPTSRPPRPEPPSAHASSTAHRHQEWMAARVNRPLADGPPGTPFGAATLRQLVRRVDPALVAAQTTASRGVEPPAIHDAITVLRFRYDMLKELDDDHSAG